jgi:hypothetical protein
MKFPTHDIYIYIYIYISNWFHPLISKLY